MCDVVYLGVDLHCQEKPEAGMRLHGVELLFQLHQPPGGQVDVFQHHPPAGRNSQDTSTTKQSAHAQKINTNIILLSSNVCVSKIRHGIAKK